MKKLTYKNSGVDIKKADDFVKGIKGFVSTSSLATVSAFGSLFSAGILKKYRNPILVSSADGVGTKLLIAQRLNIHNTVGVDLVGMNVNDIVSLGARPLFFLDYIACGKLIPRVLKEVVRGIHQGLNQADCPLLGGETAEMPGMYKPGEYDLAGFCVGAVDKDKIIDGRRIKPKDAVIGLASTGPHSNGYSLIRRALGSGGIKKYANEVLKPTRIYVKPILAAIGRRPSAIKGIAHITGGAFYNKATKIMPRGLGMVINARAWRVPPIFTVIQRKGNIANREMYQVFNMGIGMILIVQKDKVNRIQKIISQTKVKSYLIGEVQASRKKIQIMW